MKTQCDCCYKRFEVIRDVNVPVSTDPNAKREHIYCPWCGAENGTVEKGSLVKVQKTDAECEF
jgi:Zn finger protein HypA/HybF involved in hydrogenase expression